VVDLPSYLLKVIFLGVWIFESFWLKLISGVITSFLSGVIFYSIYKIWLINESDFYKYLTIFNIETEKGTEKRKTDERWVDILGHTESSHSHDWSMAVIECDKILDELLKEAGFEGENIGERLRSKKAENLKSLQDAWEGHKIRNRIAHEPGYVLEKRDARKAVAHYEIVFREFGFID